MKYLITIASLFLSTTLLAQTESFNLSNGQLVLENSSGNVSVTGTNESTVKISYTKKKWEEGCDLKLEQSNDIVNVKVKAKKRKDSGWFSSGPNCQVNFTITMPKQVILSTLVGSGNTTISGLMANATLKSGSGDINLINSQMDSLKASVGSGDIKTSGLFTNATLESGSGDIKLINSQRKAHMAKLESGSGAISVMIPQGLKIKSKLNSASGKVQNKVQESNDSKYIINANTGSGDITIENL
ncbi:DUF4097 family beta strand repeat-containing protein [Halobacteriovorax sp. DPLXC-1]|uniref:DUF4097 family beta strand repeat-containing protein n=1 Tax=Halobacteriovorax sp. DPLXC-1 TaxID=3110771 RepID=UPI002FF22FD9